MVDLRIYIRTKEMLNLLRSAALKNLLASNSKLRKTEIGKKLKNESNPCRPEVFMRFLV